MTAMHSYVVTSETMHSYVTMTIKEAIHSLWTMTIKVMHSYVGLVYLNLIYNITQMHTMP